MTTDEFQYFKYWLMCLWCHFWLTMWSPTMQYVQFMVFHSLDQMNQCLSF